MRKCVHGVRIPEWHKGKDSPYCSGCGVIEPDIKGIDLGKLIEEWEDKIQNTQK